MPSKVARESQDVVKEKIKLLKKVIPECFSDGVLDFEELRKTLGKTLDSNDEKYTFSWAGRNNTFKAIQAPSKGTLIPDKKESVNFDETENIFIEGDNLEILKLLQKSYFEKIKLIYVDPPYNTGKDFVYKDNFHNGIQAYLEQTGQIENGIKLTTNPETSGRFHSDWISMMYARLFLARNLLNEEGVIFVSIDDKEVYNLRQILNEVFGEENFLGTIIWQTATDNNATQIATEHEYVVCYAKNKDMQLDWELPSEKSQLIKEKYEETKRRIGNVPDKIQEELTNWIRTQIDKGDVDLGGVSHYNYVDEKGVFYPGNSANPRPGGYNFDIIHPVTKKVCAKPENGYRWPEKTFLEAMKRNDVFWGEDHTTVPKIKKRLETTTELLKSTYYEDNRKSTRELTDLFGVKIFDNPKSPRLLSRLIKFATKNNDYVLDIFAGSCTTAEAVFTLNKMYNSKRKFIMIQIPEPTREGSVAMKNGFKNIAEIGKERIRKVIKNITAENRQQKLTPNSSPDLGFKVFKLAKSNFQIWDNYEGKDAKKLKEQLKLFESPLIAGAKDLDIIYECIIKEGFNLNSKIEKTNIKTNDVYKISDGDSSFYITLDKTVKSETIDKLNLTKDDTFICIDASLDDSRKTNLSKQCNLKTL